MEKWTTGKIIEKKCWTENLFSITVDAKVKKFIAGQFTKIGLKIDNKKIYRAYSYVNSPKELNLEFYLAKIQGGKLSKHIYSLLPGDDLIIQQESSGFFILDRVPSCKYLWMMATGTAIGPYISILNQSENLDRFEKIILIYAVRFIKDLNYFYNLLNVKNINNKKLNILTIVSQEKHKKSLMGRIPSLIIDGILESKIGIKLNNKNSHVMLCGNPQMVNDTQKVLYNKYNMIKHFKHHSGHITSENYW